MADKRLTDFSLRSLPVPVSGQTYWDDAVVGFGVRVSQGGSRSFVLVNGNDRKRHTIGRSPTLSLSDARTEAKRLIAELTLGIHQVKTTTFDDALLNVPRDVRTAQQARHREGVRPASP
jgi:hypothetical protein